MSKRYKFIFFVRFAGYFLFLSGIAGFIFMAGPLVQAEVGYRVDKFRGIKRTVPQMVSFGEEKAESSPAPSGQEQQSEGFSNLKETDGESIIPVSTEYGIVIEKINANARIVPDVNPAIESEYMAALSMGVAEALGSARPGQPGNLYLFSHSTDAPWNIVRFNAVFFLLRELEKGDRVIIFYQNKRYDYIVFEKTIARPDDISYLTNKYDFPVLTLQTCDPPGTTLNRLIVRARLAGS